jgi:hypothetical protein
MHMLSWSQGTGLAPTAQAPACEGGEPTCLVATKSHKMRMDGRISVPAPLNRSGSGRPAFLFSGGPPRGGPHFISFRGGPPRVKL